MIINYIIILLLVILVINIIVNMKNFNNYYSLQDNILPQLQLDKDGNYEEIKTGNKVILRGINLVNKTAPYTYTDILKPIDKHLSYIKSMGFNVVRLGICWDGVEPTMNNYDDNYINNIFNFISLLQSYEIYTLLDFHQDQYASEAGGWGHPNWSIWNRQELNKEENLKVIDHLAFPLVAFNKTILYQDTEKNINITVPKIVSNVFEGFWENKKINGIGVQDRYINMLMYILQKLKLRTDIKNAVIGIDIMNEPFPGNKWFSGLKDEYLVDIENLEKTTFSVNDLENNNNIYAKTIPDTSGKHWRPFESKEYYNMNDNKLNIFYKKIVDRFTKEINDKSIILYLEPYQLYSFGSPCVIDFNSILDKQNNLQIVFSFHNYTKDSRTCYDNATKL